MYCNFDGCSNFGLSTSLRNFIWIGDHHRSHFFLFIFHLIHTTRFFQCFYFSLARVFSQLIWYRTVLPIAGKQVNDFSFLSHRFQTISIDDRTLHNFIFNFTGKKMHFDRCQKYLNCFQKFPAKQKIYEMKKPFCDWLLRRENEKKKKGKKEIQIEMIWFEMNSISVKLKSLEWKSLKNSQNDYYYYPNSKQFWIQMDQLHWIHNKWMRHMIHHIRSNGKYYFFYRFLREEKKANEMKQEHCVCADWESLL